MNQLYDFGRNEFLRGRIDWLYDDIKVVLLLAAYIPLIDTDQFLSDIPEAYWISISQSLYEKTAYAGIAGAAPTRCVDVVGDTVSSLVLFKDTGLVSTSPLIGYIDIAEHLPLVPEGADLMINWNSNLIFKL